jgi:hypothetical protein
LWRAVFLGEAIGPFDQFHAMPPWNGPAPSQPWDVLQADAVLQFAPWRSMVFEAWSHGQMPFWNPYQLLGTPLLANSQSAGFYPLHIAMGVLHVPLYAAMTFLAWFHLFWAGLGMYVLVRRLGGVRLGGVIAGVSFSLSAFMISWSALPSVTTTVSWLPWVLACVLGIFQTNAFWGIAEHPQFKPESARAEQLVDAANKNVGARRLWTVGLALSTGMMVLAGHLQFVAFGMMACVVVLAGLFCGQAGLLRGRKNWTIGPALASAGRCVFALAIGFALAAPQLLPVLEFSKRSHRRSAPTAEGYSSYVATAIKPFEVVGIVFPKMLGDPSAYAPGVNIPSGLPGFWLQFVKRGGNFAESAFAIGPVVLLLLFHFFGRKRFGTEVWAVMACGVLGVLIAFGTPLDRLLYFGVPGWSSTGSPGRAAVLFVLSACVLAGLGVESSSRASKFSPLMPFLLIGVGTLLATPLVLAAARPFVPALDDLFGLYQGVWISAAFQGFATLLVVGAVALYAARNGRNWKPLMLAVSVLPALLAWGVLRTGDASFLKAAAPPRTERSAFLNDRWNLFYRPNAFMPPNLAALTRQVDAAGYDSLLDAETKKILDEVNGGDSSPPENGNMLFLKLGLSRSSRLQVLEAIGVSSVHWWDRGGMQSDPNMAAPSRDERRRARLGHPGWVRPHHRTSRRPRHAHPPGSQHAWMDR